MVLDSFSDFFHHGIVEIQIMDNTETETKHLVTFEEMTYVSAGVAFTYWAVAGFIDWSIIQFVLLIFKIHFAMVSVHLAMASVS